MKLTITRHSSSGSWVLPVCLAWLLIGLTVTLAPLSAGDIAGAAFCLILAVAPIAVYEANRVDHSSRPIERRVRIAAHHCGRKGCNMVRPWTRMHWDPALGYVCPPDDCEAFDEPATHPKAAA